MNRSALDYYIGSARPKRLSPQCRQVREILLDGAAEHDYARLRAVLEYLDGRRALEEDTVRWLRRGLRGHYGGEGYVLAVSPGEEARFWHELHRRYPADASLCFTAADALYLAAGDRTEAFCLFLR